MILNVAFLAVYLLTVHVVSDSVSNALDAESWVWVPYLLMVALSGVGAAQLVMERRRK